MADQDRTFSPNAPTTISCSEIVWYEATYAAAAAYLADLSERPGWAVEVRVDGRLLSEFEQAQMRRQGRVASGDRNIQMVVDGRTMDVLVKRSAMRVLWGAGDDARSNAIIAKHRAFLVKLARAKVETEGANRDDRLVLSADDLED